MKAIFSLTIVALTAALLLAPGNAEAAKEKKKGPDLDATFKKLDTDSDGKLSAAEFAKFEMKKKAEATPPTTPKKPAKANKKLDAAFAKLDTDKNGSLSLDEFKKVADAKKEKKKKADK